MARIVRPTAYGTPDVLGVFELRIPRPAFGEVVVGVRAAGVNPIDWKLYSGTFHTVDDAHKDTAGVAADALPALGLECAGVVTAIGAGVTGVELGDEVIVHPVTAAYADYVTAPVTSLTPKPATLSWEEAAGLMLSGTTAAHTLHAVSLGRGDTVLVHGGSGGAGLMAVQLATARGATVLATAAERNHDLLRELGAVPVVYGPGLLERVRAAAPDGVTAAVDCAGTDEALDVSLELVADRARIASVVGSDRRVTAGVKVLGYGPGQDAGTEVRMAARAGLAAGAGAGELRVLIESCYPLYEAAQAHKSGIAGHAPGKLVLVP
ncbi:NADP-dependent oxidoreductase [Streptomyces kanamyceticus]|uniref:NADP-dependent oxidoreductase n=1 Tax=Streptomyces kanamyceticus TaxID=1967 RepID=A0A5J6GUN7_STRKN|nr:NADP-dependent oxidoreductase [Streptomyces kanamyceticus]QEU96786.1 NADP-dependent oxidoreductase [Streptomyces kanamyceticus]